MVAFNSGGATADKRGFAERKHTTLIYFQVPRRSVARLCGVTPSTVDWTAAFRTLCRLCTRSSASFVTEAPTSARKWPHLSTTTSPSTGALATRTLKSWTAAQVSSSPGRSGHRSSDTAGVCLSPAPSVSHLLKLFSNTPPVGGSKMHVNQASQVPSLHQPCSVFCRDLLVRVQVTQVYSLCL